MLIVIVSGCLVKIQKQNYKHIYICQKYENPELLAGWREACWQQKKFVAASPRICIYHHAQHFLYDAGANAQTTKMTYSFAFV